MDPVSGALLGVVFQELYATITRYMEPSLTRVSTLRSKLGVLAGKVEELSRRFAAIDERYPEVGPRQETLKLRELLEKADALVRDCGRLRRRNLRRKRRFSRRLSELTASFERLLSEDFGPGAMMGRLMTVQAEMAEVKAKLDRLMSFQAEVVRMNAKLDRMYVGRQVRSGGGDFVGGRRGMRAEVRYERTEKKAHLYISL